MSKRPAKPADMSWVTPYLIVKDADAALAFYKKAFGFEEKVAMPGPDGKLMHAEVKWRDCVIMFGPEGPTHPAKSPRTLGVRSPVGIYVYCDDVDALYRRALDAGAVSDRPPQDQFYGDRTCTVTDPDGHSWSFGTNVADFDPSKRPK